MCNHRNSVVQYLVNIPILAFVLTIFGGFFFCEDPLEPWWHGGEFHVTYYSEYIYYVSATCIFLYIGTYVRNRNSAYQLQIFGTDKPIPVSRNNTAEVKEKLSAL